DAWTGAVGSSGLLLNRLDKLIAVPGLLGDELQDDQAKVAVGEEAAEASSASLPTMRTAMVAFVLAVFYAAEATAVALVMGNPAPPCSSGDLFHAGSGGIDQRSRSSSTPRTEDGLGQLLERV